jgi:hypothetical protein
LATFRSWLELRYMVIDFGGRAERRAGRYWYGLHR